MTQNFKTIIVDDEESSISNLKFLLSEYHPQITILGTANHFESAKKLLEHTEIDLAFLDVQFGTKNIFEFLESISPIYFSIIFISAYNHALQAFQFDAVDYLLKPIDINLLHKAIYKAQQKKMKNVESYTASKFLMENLKDKSTEKIAIASTSGYEIISTTEIYYFTANGSYTNVFLIEGRKIISSKNLKFFEQMTAASEFIRIHNSSLINKNFVKKIYKSDGGFVVMKNDKKLTISASKKNDVFKTFGLT